MKTPRFYKYSATGNDFLILDLRVTPFESHRSRKEWVPAICSRRFGIGADGVVILEREENLDFKWDFFNADGSSAEMCGNASRCVSLHLFREENKKNLRFKTLAGLIETDFLGPQNIVVKMSKITTQKWDQTEQLGDQKILYDFVIAGVPHAIIKVANFNNPDSLRKLAREFKSRSIFGKSSTNVTFIRELANQRIQSVTFERGVENFTLSCGTGAVAAAASLLRGEENKSIKIQVPGGKLNVTFKDDRPFLMGDALFVGEINLHEHYFSKDNI